MDGNYRYLQYVMQRLNTLIFNAEQGGATTKQITDSLKGLVIEYKEAGGKL